VNGEAANVGRALAASGFAARRDLVLELVRRDLAARYRGSTFELLWPLITPLLMLGAYVLVFGVAFRGRGTVGEGSTASLAVSLYAGLLVHGILAESMLRAPGLVAADRGLVRKVGFPLGTLPVATVAVAALHAFAGFLLLVVASPALGVEVRPTAALAPFLVAPLVLVALGVSWFLAGLGAFIRDTAQVVGVVSLLVLFLSPVFYPSAALPPGLRWPLAINPVSWPVESVRAALFGDPIEWGGGIAWTVAGLAIAASGRWWFRRLQGGFTDVL
jgi:lipopolysaccharide transport system permease protein